MSRLPLLVVSLVVTVAVTACGGDTTSTTTIVSTTTTPPATTATTTSVATTTAATTTVPAAADLDQAVLGNGDPWVVPIAGVTPTEITLDDIWPIDRFPTERAEYEAAGFEAASFAFFQEDGALVITAAHRFADSTGAAQALALIRQSFGDPELIASITGLAPGSLNMAFPMDGLGIGDATEGVLVSGPEAQVVGVIWTVGDTLQFVRAGMALGDEDRAAAVITLARALAERAG